MACILLGDQQPLQDSSMVDTVFWNNGRVREVRQYDKGIYDYDFRSWHWNGVLHRLGRFEDQDTYVDSSWDCNGTIQVAGGNGPYIEYHEDGTPARTGFFHDRRQDSTWTNFHTNGRPSSRGTYGEYLWHRREQGEWTTWFENGRVSSRGSYEQGVQAGPMTYFHPNGRVSYTRDSSDFMNRAHYEQAFDSSGVRILDKGAGYFVDYHPNGQRSSLCHVTDFHKDTVLSYHPNGLPSERMVHLTDSTRNVWWNTGLMLDAWDSTGKHTLVNGTGYRWTVPDDGTGRSLLRYVDGLSHGQTELYDHAGRLQEVNCYDRGNWTGRVIYYNNGLRYSDYDCFNAPWQWQDEEIFWWYNGRLRSYDNHDSVVLYYPSGQLRAVGYYPTDSAAASRPGAEYMLLGKTLGGRTYPPEDTVWERLDGTGMSMSYTFSSTSLPDDWRRTYYADGHLSAQVEWMDTCSCLIRTEYYPGGSLHWVGPIGHGTLKLDPKLHDGDTYFIGYHRTGHWNEFLEDHQLLQVVNFDDRPPKERWIENYSSPSQ